VLVGDLLNNCNMLLENGCFNAGAANALGTWRAAGRSPGAPGPVPGIEDPITQQILQIWSQLTALLLPYHGGEIPPEILDQAEALRAQAHAVAGGDAVQYVRERLRELEARLAPLEPGREPSGNAPPYPIAYVAEVLRPSGLLQLRGEADAFGQYSLFVPRDGRLLFVSFYDARTKSSGRVYPRKPNVPYRPRLYLSGRGVHRPHTGVDTRLAGQAPIRNLTATRWRRRRGHQGTDLLDGLPARTGIIATADTGTAVDVCTERHRRRRGFGSRCRCSTFNGMNPVIIAQVDTPGDARRVACAGAFIAVADGSSGLAIIDASDPPAARVVHQVPLGGTVRAVAAAGSVAYAALDSRTLAAVDLASGLVISEVNTAGDIHDVAIEGDAVFVLLANELLAYSTLPEFGLQGRGTPSNVQPEGITGRKRLFVGGGIAYVTSFPGFDTFDVSNLLSLRRLGSATDGGPNSFKQIVANGSGLGIAAVGVNPRDDGTHDVWLYDISDPSRTTAFITLFATPGLTRAVSISNGIAYAADGSAGLQVINYLAYDAAGAPPTISIETNLRDGLAEEGQIFRVSARG
jgi:hypothetical protein